MKKVVDLVIIDINKNAVSRITKRFFFQAIQSEKNNLKKKEFSLKKQNLIPFYSEKKELRENRPSFLCTISGGQDSILTLFLLLHSKKKESLQILYCQHLWQIKNFFSARLIFQVSYLVKIPYTLILPQKQVLTENEARDWRKKNYSRFSQMEHILTSITGHTETDTLEKNINHILRGTSPSGLSSFGFLASQKKVGSFFSTRNLTPKTDLVQNRKKTPKTAVFSLWFSIIENERDQNGNSFFFSNLQKTRFCKRLFFENKKKKNSHQRGLKRNSLNKKTQIFKKKFQFFKTRGSFDSQAIFSVNGLNAEKSLLFYLPLEGKAYLNKTSLSDIKNVFRFFYFTKTERKNQGNGFVKETKTYSFCFSTKFSTMKPKFKKPLEKINRFSVSTMIKLYQLPLLIDITNFSSGFSRNKIRHQLVPFIRCLVQPSVESLLTNFFTLINYQQQGIEKQVQEFYFLLKLSKLNYRKDKTQLKSQILFLVNKCSTKKLLKTVSRYQVKCLIQKLFFDYRNLNLTSSQIKKLQEFF